MGVARGTHDGLRKLQTHTQTHTMFSGLQIDAHTVSATLISFTFNTLHGNMVQTF